MSRSRRRSSEDSSRTERVESGRTMLMIVREPVMVLVGGIQKEMSGFEYLLRQTFQLATKGDKDARRDVIELVRLGSEAERIAYLDLLNWG